MSRQSVSGEVLAETTDATVTTVPPARSVAPIDEIPPLAVYGIGLAFVGCGIAWAAIGQELIERALHRDQ